MMQAFRTENNYRNASRLSAAELRAAMASREILQSTALAFDTQRQLRFELGGCRAVMPFGQCADGADTGSVRDIAVLTRVGRPTCFVIEGIDTDENGQPVYRLSRAEAQRMCKAEYLDQLQPGDILPCRVTHLESFLAQQAREMKETDGTLSYTYRLAQAGREGAFQLEGRIDRLPGPGGQGAFSEVEDLRKQAARLMDSPLMRLLVGTAPVRYPVVRTNLIKKNPNFQKAMELYEFLIAHQDGLIAVSFGEAPVIAYLAAKEAEIVAIRIIMTGRLAGLPTDVIRERLREAYV